MKKVLLLLMVGLLTVTCTKDEVLDPLDYQLQNLLRRRSPDGDLQYFTLPDETDYAQIPQGRGNPLTPEKVALGKMLFFETGLGQDAVKDTGKGTFSCATCHVPSAGFMPGSVQGIADGGFGFGRNGESRTKAAGYRPEELDVQGARPLSVLNVAYVTNTTWSGKFGAHFVNEGTEAVWAHDPVTEVNELGLDGLESQNMEGLALHRMVVNKPLLDSLGYTAMFDQAFPEMDATTRYGPMGASFAISAYLRTLLPNQAPYQQWLRGNLEAMTELEKRGALLFFGKAGCYRCHKGPGLNSMEFHALGVKDLYEAGAFATGEDDIRNFGRGGFTGRQEDMYKFKVPQIYNMADSPFYFHGSSKRSLHELVKYFNEAIPENDRIPEANLSPFFHPLKLSDKEVDQLVQFLETGLHDPNLDRFVPQEVLSGNCFPNNDPESRWDLGCY